MGLSGKASNTLPMFRSPMSTVLDQVDLEFTVAYWRVVETVVDQSSKLPVLSKAVLDANVTLIKRAVLCGLSMRRAPPFWSSLHGLMLLQPFSIPTHAPVNFKFINVNLLVPFSTK